MLKSSMPNSGLPPQAIVDAPLRELVVTLLEGEQRAAHGIPPLPAGITMLFAVGLLEHTVSVTRTGIYLAEKYSEYYADLDPPINKDLVVAGCILHDIGQTART